MGQYFKPVNVNKLEYLYSHHFDAGLKMMEHAYFNSKMVQAVVRLLSPGGSWYKCNLVWAGDYGDEGAFVPGKDGDGKGDNPCLYAYVASDGKNALKNHEIIEDTKDYELKQKRARRISKKWLNTLPTPGIFLTNHSKKTCINLADELSDIHPLPILTANGNGQGGGDYHGSNMALVGFWAGDSISVEPEAIFPVSPPINFSEKNGEEDGDYEFVDGSKKSVAKEKTNKQVNPIIVVSNSTLTEVPIKRKRGRPRKNPIVTTTQTIIPAVSEKDIPEEDRSLLDLLG